MQAVAPIPKIDDDEVDIDKLVSYVEGKLVESSKINNSRWSAFPNDPKDMSGVEATIFELLGDLWKDIMDIVKT